MESLKKRKLAVVLSVYIAFVFIQSLFFKFTDAPETQHIFSTLNVWAFDTFGIDGLFVVPGIFNAYVIGTVELIASTFLILGIFTGKKLLTIIGAEIAFFIITGAIFFHLFTPLGVNVQGDGGVLFTLACGVWLSSVALLINHKNTIVDVFKKLKKN